MGKLPVLLVAWIAACGDDSGGQVDAGPAIDASADAAPAIDASADAAPAIDAAPGSGTLGGCAALAVEHGVDLDGYLTDRYTWSDGACRPRSAALVRNDGADPGGTHGGYLRTATYQTGGVTRTIAAQETSWHGWGYIVNHYASTAATSADVTGDYRTVFAGAHHAVHEFTLRVSPGGPVDVTVYWVFATGRSAPLVALTHDATPAGADAVDADARGPYGNLIFDEVDGDVAGMAWGDQYRLITTSSPLTFDSSWDYTAANLIPHVLMWSAGADAEMGLVQSQAWVDQIAGGDYGGGMLADCQGHTSAAPGDCSLQAGGTMLTDWLWPYQLSQWELPWGSTSKRMAWGHTYGAVGQSSYWAFGADRPGYPYLSYALYLVLGPHSGHPTDDLIAEMAAVKATTVTASVGTVATSGPGGAGRTDTVAYTPAGWDPVLGAWTFASAGGAVTARFVIPAGASLPNPVIRVRDWTSASGPTQVSVDGTPLTEGVGWVASVDTEAQVLWLTIGRTCAGTVDLAIE
jgi:hypothetical protein